MRHLAVRLASILILALGFAQVASAAEVWTFAHFVENEGTLTAESFDSVLYLMNKGGGQVHRCSIELFDESNNRSRTRSGREVCPSPGCAVTVNGFLKFKIHDAIAAAMGGAGAPWDPKVFLGEIRLSCAEPLFGLNATLYVANYHENGFKAAFAVDNGKILP